MSESVETSGNVQVLGIERRFGNLARWILFLIGALALRSWRGLDLIPDASPSVEWYIWGVYGAYTLLLTLASLPCRLNAWLEQQPDSALATLLLVFYALDYLFVSALVALTGGFRSDLFVLYGILALKAAIYYPYLKRLIWISFGSGPLWVIAAFYDAGRLFFLADRAFLVRYLELFLFILGCLSIGWFIERRQRSIIDLDANLSLQSETLENQARVIQRTANELANRLLELRSLQESVKAINSALALDELLQLIVESATQVLRGARCAVALVDERHGRVVTSAVSGIPRQELVNASVRLGEGVIGWVVENRQPVLLDDAPRDPRFRPMDNWPVASLIAVPLVSENRVIGALVATSEEARAFTEADLNLLDAFGDQAAIAVKNARLYEQLLREEKETARLYQSVLEKSNELEAILRGIGDGVIVVDPYLRLMMMNPVAARILGITEAPSPGVRLPEIVSHKPLLDLVNDTLVEGGTPLIREIVMGDESTDPNPAIYQALASSVKGINGHMRGVVVVMRDITSQKEIEQMKSDFLSVVSHELRTPLHSIKGFVEIILMGRTGEINELQRDFLTTVKESTINLQRLIDDLLEFSRMEAGQIKLRPEEISLQEVTTQVVERLAPLAQEGELTLINQVPATLPIIEADPMRIEQVLTNLISNAIKFTPAGGSITVSGEDLGDQVRMWVRDTGIGIPKEEQGRIFQRFYQVDGGATRSYTGTGLGLTISKFIIEYHHGRIWVESEEGKGSTFYFVLPKKLPQDENLVIDFTTPARRR
ncbi:MAG: GAF domain-containing protein [Chloroflexi bacterium]|nr:GAF domain-containing protein [Chloroflexota bacterium]